MNSADAPVANADPGVLAVVDAFAGRWGDRAAEAERGRRLPDATVAELLDTGLLELAAPPGFGGPGHSWPTLVEAARRAARACPSTGWVIGVVGGHAALAGRLPRTAAGTVFAAGVRQVFATASAAADGRLTRVPGGFEAAGRWRFCSAADHADWFLLNGHEHGGDPRDRVVIPLAAGQVRVEDGWDVCGMAGTGSRDIVVERVFVPEALTGSLPSCFAGRRPSGTGTSPYYLGEVPFLPYANSCVIGPVLGCAEGAFAAFLARFARGSGTSRPPEQPLVRDGLTESAAELACARHLYEAVCARLHAAGAARGALPPEDVAAIGRDRAYLARLCVRSVHRLVRLAGTAAHFADDPLARHWRDLQMMAAHRDLDWARNAEAYATAAFTADGPGRAEAGTGPVPGGAGPPAAGGRGRAT
ncbi:acyl-CoA dehydrogenase family protein [Streptomyces prasinus]|uniref:acyl-CoA dehydrogenase family protein n=1 Tax=Streptomyces prasinus TaxID=67345 RepID=UPI0006EB650B|nr:acyl-CoA dehydrogenase family protein [Streptomyces prasinus]